MSWRRTILIGGVQGEGVASTGINLMRALAGLGYHVYGERKFSSRIKGGNTHMIITIGDDHVTCVESVIDIILAFDEESISFNQIKLRDNGIILMDETLTPEASLTQNINTVALPLTLMAKKHGSLLMKNTSAIGYLGKLLGIQRQVLESSIAKTYLSKGDEVIQQNLQVLLAAYDDPCPELEKIDPLPDAPHRQESMMILMGNDAIALGALMAGCRFMAAYPITPASDVMETMSRVFPDEGGLMVQTEDEVAAITMCIGAGYAGVRSMTATSGPGLTLMMEGLGLAGMTETPIVVVDAQRGGPSTGLPTRTEQSDFSALYHAGHGEFPLILLTPSTIEECYELTKEAFNLADIFQCPVVVMTDLNLSLSPQTIPAFDYVPAAINRGVLMSLEDELSAAKITEPFARYALTENGLSPRSFPGMPGGIHQVTGLEHNKWGRPSDQPANRQKMMDKRLRKLEPLKDQSAVHLEQRDGKMLCLTCGSSWGVLQQAVKDTYLSVDIGRISRIRPLPKRQLQQLLANYEKIIVMEQNQQGQLALILRQELNHQNNIVSMTRYDGESFQVQEVRHLLEGWCSEWK
ncbi:2-oxoglutarate ferredoxin oxidoreductase subunit alpha [Anoxynatronum buryatiense]|uniref:2-oxoglutarate ferredoxin oxidoreductase subunit alpha n=1 Tax=Anoxynatronum buryatiense TaxID=489973 RepID=A0AA45WSH1_9CLOT|nr:2-oxoglutarate ferredoxin oxidoreductase subunit alpha [Anoxynatronum buryatiense]